MTTDKARQQAAGDRVEPAPERAAPARDAAEPAHPPLEEYLAGIDPSRAPLVRELDRLVLEAAPEVDAAVKYRMLTYAIGRDWWRWVVAIGVTKSAVHLRFLYGTRLEAGAGVLRPGSSHLATLDLAPERAPGAGLDADLIIRLVGEAVARHAGFLSEEHAPKA